MLSSRYILLFLFIICLGTTGCSTVTVDLAPDSERKLLAFPSYQERKGYLFWGLVNNDFNESEICQEGAVRLMEHDASLVDGVFSTATFGIYSPRTVKVWCDTYLTRPVQ